MKTTTLRTVLTALAATCFLTIAAFAGDPTGTWTWSQTSRNGHTAKSKLTLTLKDGSLTGFITERNQNIAISNASINGDMVTFSIVRKPQEDPTKSIIRNFSGKLDGDTIIGSFEVNHGQSAPVKFDWNATRGAAATPNS